MKHFHIIFFGDAHWTCCAKAIFHFTLLQQNFISQRSASNHCGSKKIENMKMITIEKFLGRFELKSGCLFIGWFTIAYGAIALCCLTLILFDTTVYDCKVLLKDDCEDYKGFLIFALLLLGMFFSGKMFLAYYYVRGINIVSKNCFLWNRN